MGRDTQGVKYPLRLTEQMEEDTVAKLFVIAITVIFIGMISYMVWLVWLS